MVARFTSQACRRLYIRVPEEDPSAISPVKQIIPSFVSSVIRAQQLVVRLFRKVGFRISTTMPTRRCWPYSTTSSCSGVVLEGSGFSGIRGSTCFTVMTVLSSSQAGTTDCPSETRAVVITNKPPIDIQVNSLYTSRDAKIPSNYPVSRNVYWCI